jgi:hypothetical protein
VWGGMKRLSGDKGELDNKRELYPNNIALYILVYNDA